MTPKTEKCPQKIIQKIDHGYELLDTETSKNVSITQKNDYGYKSMDTQNYKKKMSQSSKNGYPITNQEGKRVVYSLKISRSNTRKIKGLRKGDDEEEEEA